MPEFVLDCKHPEPTLEESYIEENPPGQTFRVARYHCPDCDELFERTGPTRVRMEP